MDVLRPCVKPERRSSETMRNVLSGSSFCAGLDMNVWYSMSDWCTMRTQRSNTGCA